MSNSFGRTYAHHARRFAFILIASTIPLGGFTEEGAAQELAVDSVSADSLVTDSLWVHGIGMDSAAMESLFAKIARLRTRLDSLSAVVARLRAAGIAVVPADSPVDSVESESAVSDPLAAIRAAAAAALGEPEDSTDATGRPSGSTGTAGRSSLRSLNPEITVTGDLFAYMDAEDPGSATFVAREFELALQSWLDPYARAKIFLGRHAPGGGLPPFEHTEDAADEHGAEIEFEEGYVNWVNLPFGIGITLGKFRQRFGTLNRWHAHALPAQQLPLPYLAFFGEHGLAQTGISAHWLAPVELMGGTYEAWFEVTRAANERLFGAAEGLTALAHLNTFYELSPATYFEVGFTGLAGPAEGDGIRTRLAGLDFALSWRPPAQALYREATLRGGAVYGRVGLPDGTLGDAAFGAFVLGEYRLNRRWVVGARYEFTEDPFQPDRSSWLVAPTLSWWQSEFVRLRAEFDSLHRPFGTTRRFLIQTTISMGPHKHATY